MLEERIMADPLGVVIAAFLILTVAYVTSIIYIVRMLRRFEDRVRMLEEAMN